MRQLISEAIDAHLNLKLLRFEELLLTGEFQIDPYSDKVINRLVLTLRCAAWAWLPSILSRLHSCGYFLSVFETEPQDYPNQGFTQEAACYIIQRDLLRARGLEVSNSCPVVELLKTWNTSSGLVIKPTLGYFSKSPWYGYQYGFDPLRLVSSQFH